MEQEPIQWHRDHFLVKTDIAALDRVAVHLFLEDAPWSHGRSAATIDRALRNSLCFSLFENNSQIGLARIVTDYATYAYLCDVYLLKEFRSQGLGSWLIQCVLEHPALKDLRRISLLTHDAQGFYARFGFENPGSPGRYMERTEK